MKKFLSLIGASLMLGAGIAQADAAEYQYYLRSIDGVGFFENQTYTYNEQGNLIEMTDNTNFDVRRYYEYDAAGHCTKLITEQMLDGEFVMVYYITYGYNANGQRITRDNYNKSLTGNEMEHSATIYYEYDADGRLIAENIYMEELAYEYHLPDPGYFIMTLYSYDKDGNMESKEVRGYSPLARDYVTQDITYYTYANNPDGSGKSYITGSEYDIVVNEFFPDELEAYTYIEYLYDDDWNLIQYNQYNASTDARILQVDYIYGDIPASSIAWPYEPESPSANQIYSLVNKNIVSQSVSKLDIWGSGKFEYYGDYEYTYSVKPAGDSGVNSVIINDRVMTVRSISKDALTLDGVNANDMIRIFSADGKEVSRFVYTGNTVDISNLPSGVYMVTSYGNAIKFVK